MASNQVIGLSGLTSDPVRAERDRQDKLNVLARETAMRQDQMNMQRQAQQATLAESARRMQYKQAMADADRQLQERKMLEDARRYEQDFGLREKAFNQAGEQFNQKQSLAEFEAMQKPAMTPYQEASLGIERQKLDNVAKPQDYSALADTYAGLGLTPQEATTDGKVKFGIKKDPMESASLKKQYLTEKKNLETSLQDNEYKVDLLNQAETLAKSLPTGLLGAGKTQLIKWFDANNPMLGGWQGVKSLLTEAQLEYTSKTKGAISDREMGLFSQAVANDDILSMSRMSNVFNKLKKYYDKEKKTAVGVYGQMYGKDELDNFISARSQYNEPEDPVMQDPRVQQALAEGYSIEQIKSYLGV